MSTPSPREVERELIQRHEAQKTASDEVLQNPPRELSIPDIDALQIDAELKKLLKEAVRISNETEQDGAVTDVSTILQQSIAQSELEFTEDDLIIVTQYLGVKDVPTWFEELASWL